MRRARRASPPSAGRAEAAGFESVWAGEHVVLPDPQVPPSPMAPQDPALDPLLALAWAAACTSTIRLATGIIILPQRNPVVLAKQVASLDVLSGGRSRSASASATSSRSSAPSAPTSSTAAR